MTESVYGLCVELVRGENVSESFGAASNVVPPVCHRKELTRRGNLNCATWVS
jgi:hypothetical protein